MCFAQAKLKHHPHSLWAWLPGWWTICGLGQAKGEQFWQSSCFACTHMLRTLSTPAMLCSSLWLAKPLVGLPQSRAIKKNKKIKNGSHDEGLKAPSNIKEQVDPVNHTVIDILPLKKQTNYTLQRSCHTSWDLSNIQNYLKLIYKKNKVFVSCLIFTAVKLLDLFVGVAQFHVGF